MITRNKIIEWFQLDQFIDFEEAIILGEGGKISKEQNDTESALQSARSINYAIPLYLVDGFSVQSDIDDRCSALRDFESSVCFRLKEKIYDELGLEGYSDAKYQYLWGLMSAFMLLDTKYKLSIMIKVQWHESTYAGDLYVPVYGLADDIPRGILNVSIALINSHVTWDKK